MWSKPKLARKKFAEQCGKVLHAALEFMVSLCCWSCASIVTTHETLVSCYSPACFEGSICYHRAQRCCVSVAPDSAWHQIRVGAITDDILGLKVTCSSSAKIEITQVVAAHLTSI